MIYISRKNYYIEINSSKIHTITSRSKYWNKFPTKQTNEHISIFLFLPIIKNKRSHTKLNKQTLLNIHLNFLSPYNLPRNKYPSPSTLSQSQRESSFRAQERRTHQRSVARYLADRISTVVFESSRRKRGVHARGATPRFPDRLSLPPSPNC